MLKLVAQRLALGLLTLFVVSILIFGATEILPGDVATAILGPDATPESLEAIRRELHLHDPAVERYVRWLTQFAHGDLGQSLANNRPVAELLGFRLQNTFFLAGLVAIVAVPVAVGLGILSAYTQNSWFDRIITTITLSITSLPTFFLGYVVILIVSIKLRWLPSLSLIAPEMGFGERLYVTALPAATLAFAVLAHMMRMTRASIIGVMSSPFIEMAYLKGLSRWRVVLGHALPNAIAPIVNVIAVNLAWLIIGVIVIEVVFVYPGIGQLMVDAVATRDVPVVQACGLVFAATYVLLNLIADLFAIASNPLLRKPR
jgi:peptide/nickel transport system permease protein